ncbi:hypothetical protein NFH98_20850 [Halomonas sp. H33-56]|uniref:hypothetical protein n=1 Tax=Halomonas sp. H33-56 TaxID=2950873 RepID=UPI0032DF144A
MARRRRSDLDDLFELWARWCHSPGGVLPSAGPSILARWMEGRGHVVFGGGGGDAPTDLVEERIEAAVMAIAARDDMTAKVLRYEYGVWSAAGEWRDQRDQEAKALTQADKARALGLGLRMYKYRLAAGRKAVEQNLGEQ